MYDLKDLWLTLGLSKSVKLLEGRIYYSLKIRYFFVKTDSLNLCIPVHSNLISLSLHLFVGITEPFITSKLKLGVNGLPVINKSLKFIQLDKLEVFGLVVDNNSTFGVDELVDDL